MLLASLAFSSRASAEKAPTRVTFHVDASCTDEGDFFRRVAERTLLVVRASAAEPADIVTVRVHAARGRVRGVVRMEGDPTGPPRERTVEGPTCEAVIDVLSLAVALAYDPDARLGRPSEDVAPPTEAPHADEPPVVEPSLAAPPPVPMVTSDVPMPRGNVRLDDRWRWEVGVHAAISATTSVPLGGEVFGDVENRWFGVRVTLGVQHWSVAVDGASAVFNGAYAAPVLCVLRLRAGAFDIAPCAGATVAVVSASPSGIEPSHSVVRPSLAGRVSSVARFELGAGVRLDAQVSLDVPLFRTEYAFADRVAYEVPRISPSLALGLSCDL